MLLLARGMTMTNPNWVMLTGWSALGMVSPKAAASASFRTGVAGVTAPEGNRGAAGQDPSDPTHAQDPTTTEPPDPLP